MTSVANFLKKNKKSIRLIFVISSVSLIVIVGIAVLFSFRQKDTSKSAVIDAFPQFRFEFPIKLDAVEVNGKENIFVAEQSGRIWRFENSDKSEKKLLILDISKKIKEKVGNGATFGLLSFALHPNFISNGKIYINYLADPEIAINKISEYKINIDGNNTNTQFIEERILFRIAQPDHTNHNVSDLVFGPDGFLYIGTGDGGFAQYSRPRWDSQDCGSLLGKILRIDVNETKQGDPYGIPPDNPFLENRNCRKEIFAMGIRMPWKMSFDRGTGDLWVGDVGDAYWEEIDIIKKGHNYGWPYLEGDRKWKAGDGGLTRWYGLGQIRFDVFDTGGIYSDYLGAGHAEGISVSASSVDDEATGLRTVSVSGGGDSIGWRGGKTAPSPNPDGAAGHWLLYDFGSVYQLSTTHIWNSNESCCTHRGLRNVIIDYSLDGKNWETLGEFEFSRAPGTDDYKGSPGPDFGGVRARYVLITALTNWWDPSDTYSVSPDIPTDNSLIGILTGPVFAYPHKRKDKGPVGGSVTGGFVYRGQKMPFLHGKYVFGDWATGGVWSLGKVGAEWVARPVPLPLKHSDGSSKRIKLSITSFGEDKAGELYILPYGENVPIYKIVPDKGGATDTVAVPKATTTSQTDWEITKEACDHIVGAEKFLWTNNDLTIKPNKVVCWQWQTPEAHNVAQIANKGDTERASNGFYSERLVKTEDFRVKFKSSGEYHYVCEPHIAAGMVGQIAVQD